MPKPSVTEEWPPEAWRREQWRVGSVMLQVSRVKPTESPDFWFAYFRDEDEPFGIYRTDDLRVETPRGTESLVDRLELSDERQDGH